MTPRWLWIGLSALLAAIVALAFLFPHQMVSPGDLRPAAHSPQLRMHRPVGLTALACIKPDEAVEELPLLAKRAVKGCGKVGGGIRLGVGRGRARGGARRRALAQSPVP